MSKEYLRNILTGSKVLQKLLAKFGCVAIRIDKEKVSLEELVKSIKTEIEKYNLRLRISPTKGNHAILEAGYAEAKGKYVIYAASKESIMSPRTENNDSFRYSSQCSLVFTQKRA